MKKNVRAEECRKNTKSAEVIVGSLTFNKAPKFSRPGPGRKLEAQAGLSELKKCEFAFSLGNF